MDAKESKKYDTSTPEGLVNLIQYVNAFRIASPEERAKMPLASTNYHLHEEEGVLFLLDAINAAQATFPGAVWAREARVLWVNDGLAAWEMFLEELDRDGWPNRDTDPRNTFWLSVRRRVRGMEQEWLFTFLTPGYLGQEEYLKAFDRWLAIQKRLWQGTNDVSHLSMAVAHIERRTQNDSFVCECLLTRYGINRRTMKALQRWRERV